MRITAFLSSTSPSSESGSLRDPDILFLRGLHVEVLELPWLRGYVLEVMAEQGWRLKGPWPVSTSVA